MLHTRIDIDLDYGAAGVSHVGAKASIDTYILGRFVEAQEERIRPCVVICPGGGYEHLSDREGEPVAVKLNSFGLNAVVLRYSLAPNEFPCQLYEAAYAVKYVREHADEWGIDPGKLVVGGFSAGAHVAASLGTMWNQPELAGFVRDVLNAKPECIRPDGLLLSYPVITSGARAHRMSFERLLGSRCADAAMLSSVSLETRVNQGTPPAFIWHTFADGSVPVDNSLLFANAMREQGIPFELHIYPEGSHGLALATRETDDARHGKFQPECATWADMFRTWLDNQVGSIY